LDQPCESLTDFNISVAKAQQQPTSPPSSTNGISFEQRLEEVLDQNVRFGGEQFRRTKSKYFVAGKSKVPVGMHHRRVSVDIALPLSIAVMMLAVDLYDDTNAVGQPTSPQSNLQNAERPKNVQRRWR
jgi:hypothetical protein